MFPGVSPIAIPPRPGEVVKAYVGRIETLHGQVKVATKHVLAATCEAEFLCGGGELVSGEKLAKLLIAIPGVSELLACA